VQVDPAKTSITADEVLSVSQIDVKVDDFARRKWDHV